MNFTGFKTKELWALFKWCFTRMKLTLVVPVIETLWTLWADPWSFRAEVGITWLTEHCLGLMCFLDVVIMISTELVSPLQHRLCKRTDEVGMGWLCCPRIVGEPTGANELTRDSLGNARPLSSQLAEPLSIFSRHSVDYRRRWEKHATRWWPVVPSQRRTVRPFPSCLKDNLGST